ncbi:histidine kinase dimerization/phosphoacceptor domain-containing protein [Paenibacillus sp. p3-SID1389]|uniref:histidine kinase dimerization/phosphoacceptor domain-containing protein n=1 Tax=Paenibacillus sp. p3-SID1389 TaxID=2916364 RepID=UPI0021A6A043|nr:histidine kinase dimerization/phosphoacceptor domain-containing protein [Paenibacillus sp. p3-SID1389]
MGHSLTSLIVQLQALRFMVRQDPGRAEQTIDEMLVVARQGLQDIRNSVHALADDASFSGKTALNALLSRLEASSGIRCVMQDELPDGDLGDKV